MRKDTAARDDGHEDKRRGGVQRIDDLLEELLAQYSVTCAVRESRQTPCAPLCHLTRRKVVSTEPHRLYHTQHAIPHWSGGFLDLSLFGSFARPPMVDLGIPSSMKGFPR
jgi:hypothetical protein